jgi:N-methylhydantoinase B/oxoprolinase/acetone carboxylase alpha subunit
MRLELQNAVMSEIIRGAYCEQMPANIKAVIESCLVEEREEFVKAIKEDEGAKKEIKERLADIVKSVRANGYGNNVTYVLSPTVKNLIADEVNRMILEQVKKTTEKFEETLSKEIIKFQNEAEIRVNKRIEQIDEFYRREAILAARKQVVTDLTNLTL